MYSTNKFHTKIAVINNKDLYNNIGPYYYRPNLLASGKDTIRGIREVNSPEARNVSVIMITMQR